MGETENILSTYNLHYFYPGQMTGLNGVTCGIPKRKRTVILGPNGAGKSTLLLALSGVLRPQQGHVLIEGQPADYSHPGLTRLRSRVGLVMQHPDVQLFCPSVYQDVAYGPTNLGLTRDEVSLRVQWALKVVGASGLADKPVHCLSHGEKQRVAIAGVLAMHPAVILLDEPTAGLDVSGVATLLEELERLRENDTTLVMTTHDMDLAWRWGDHFIAMEKGKVVWEGGYEELARELHLFTKVGLRLPMVGLAYITLVRRGIIPAGDNIPRDLSQLIQLIEMHNDPSSRSNREIELGYLSP